MVTKMSSDQAALDAILRQDFASFVQKAFSAVNGGERLQLNWHHEAIGWELDRIRRGEINRLIVTMPPRNLKSILISVAWVAWMLGLNPRLEFVCVSYSADLSRKLAIDCRAIMQRGWYRRIFPATRLRRGSSGGMDFQTTAGGGRFSTSVGGTLTGRGGDIIIIDDPIKPDEAMSEAIRSSTVGWYRNTLATRLNGQDQGTIVLVMQRLHEEDLAGYLLEAEKWQHLSLPAIADETRQIQVGAKRFYQFREGTALHPERESLEVLHRLKRTMGTARFSAQYQQSPVPAEGLNVKREWFRYYDENPTFQQGDRIVQSWDTASKDGVFSDFSVCDTALLRRRQVYVLDVYRAKLQFPDLKRMVISHAVDWNAKVLLIEDAASGQQLLQILKREVHPGVPRPIGRKPEADKLSRFSAQTHLIEAGEMLLPKDASWLAEFQLELLGFPNRKHDDQVDALTQLLAWHSSRRAIWLRATSGYLPELQPKLIEG